jgi:hypothetical protein
MGEEGEEGEASKLDCAEHSTLSLRFFPNMSAARGEEGEESNLD